MQHAPPLHRGQFDSHIYFGSVPNGAHVEIQSAIEGTVHRPIYEHRVVHEKQLQDSLESFRLVGRPKPPHVSFPQVTELAREVVELKRLLVGWFTASLARRARLRGSITSCFLSGLSFSGSPTEVERGECRRRTPESESIPTQPPSATPLPPPPPRSDSRIRDIVGSAT